MQYDRRIEDFQHLESDRKQSLRSQDTRDMKNKSSDYESVCIIHENAIDRLNQAADGADTIILLGYGPQEAYSDDEDGEDERDIGEEELEEGQISDFNH